MSIKLSALSQVHRNSTDHLSSSSFLLLDNGQRRIRFYWCKEARRSSSSSELNTITKALQPCSISIRTASAVHRSLFLNPCFIPSIIGLHFLPETRADHFASDMASLSEIFACLGWRQSSNSSQSQDDDDDRKDKELGTSGASKYEVNLSSLRPYYQL
jgi:hypothetical protein